MTLTLRARVRSGRLVLDEPVDLPEGSEVELVMADEQDGLDDEERARLHAALAKSVAAHRPGTGTSADTLLAELRARR